MGSDLPTFRAVQTKCTEVRVGSPCRTGLGTPTPLSHQWALPPAQAKATKTHVGGIYSSDVFYAERPDLDEQMVRHGILGVEMEAAELYTLAARHGRRALAVLTVSDHLQTGEALPSEDRERSFGDMVEIALEAAFTKS